MHNNKLHQIVNPSDRIFWEGKPDFKCFIMESIFNPMLIIAILWGAIDLTFLYAALKTPNRPDALFLIAFFTLHLMPVWIYLFGVIGCVFNYINTAYIITDKRIYISKGAFSYTTEIIPINQITNISVHRGIFDGIFGVGDVKLERGWKNVIQNQSQITEIPHSSISPAENTSPTTYANQTMQQLKTSYFSGTYVRRKSDRKRRQNTAISSTSEYLKAYRLILKLQEDAMHEEITQDRYGLNDTYFKS